ncbi:glycosyltransferase family 2 protein [Psychroflexus sp. CAK57W]|uniref:glycosyltransferase family A protein n=1 Tax=Psychroflexus curvus TaxID=2873595 RepID=UPI001CC95ACA|nr:glycosyltransferase family A protein [Psychroflexus curvus]MBZ9786317.1 glycosyltransferase family 2 protein [Psychroflexus curvus]
MKRDLEILISTMNRKDLSFLDSMFPDLNTSLYSILIINQTQHEEDLVSFNPKIRAINSREFGLSKSRNLAIENANGEILLIADDDIIYLKGFEETIYEAYRNYPEATLISFQFLNAARNLAKLYPKREGYLTSSKRPLSSVEISFKRMDIISFGIRMDERFGLGSIFPSGEEQLFKSAILQNNLKTAYVAEPLLIHPGKTSASCLESEKSIEATTAQKYMLYNNWTYLWLVKYVFFLFRHNYISFFEQIKAYSVGVKAISKFKKIENEG